MDNGQQRAFQAKAGLIPIGRRITAAGLLTLLSACATPYDIPVPTMVGTERAYSMSGVVSTVDPEKVRAKVLRLMKAACPVGLNLVQFRTEPTPRSVYKALHYEAVATCDPARGGR